MSDVDPIYHELSARIQETDEEYIPRILARLADMEQARILQALPDKDRPADAGRSLEVSDKFAGKLGMSPETVAAHIKELFEKGVVFPTRGGPQMARTWMQLHDSTLANPKYDDALGKEFFELWGKSHTKMRIPMGQATPPQASPMRVVPKWKAVKDIPGVMPCEDMREIVKSQELLVLIPCGCKRSYPQRACGIPEESCITVGRTAQYNLDRGIGREITKEEALQILDKFDAYPVVNLVVNQRDVGQLICNCHSCCCGALMEGVSPSRFVTVTDAGNCLACGLCADRCQYGALELKLDPDAGAERAYVDEEKCQGCGDCVLVCPNSARSMKMVRPPEHIPESLSIY
jgi:ferredoxin/DNA-binding transcriptional ArsR family regulator